MNMPFFSICIPAYEMNDMGLRFLKFNLETFKMQTFTDFQVVISDHSKNDDIKNMCETMVGLNIKYIKNETQYGNSCANLNNSITNADGKWIKILFQDDFLYGKTALEKLNKFIEDKNVEKWLVTGSEHTTDGIFLLNSYEPNWSLEAILKGHNTISSPSVLTFKNNKDENLMFDTNLNWLMDVDYYYRLFLKYGEPSIMKEINAVNRVWDGSVTAGLTQETKDKELEYFLNKIK
jgi:glycosyltransferase involved in cell wall biosynthesis